MAKPPPRFDLGVTQTSRGRLRGLGLGRREGKARRDPAVYGDEIEEEVERLDPNDGGPPVAAQHTENHTRRPSKSRVRRGQGPKTRAANKARAQGSPQFNPR